MANQPPTNPAEIEYKHARALMNVQELGLPVLYQGQNEFIQEFHRVDKEVGSGLQTYVYLRGNPDLIPASEITIKEQPK